MTTPDKHDPRLTDTQTAAFNADFHSVEELDRKLLRIEWFFGSRPFSILDLGGGNGHFLDTVLDRFPAARGTVLDLSDTLLSLNKPSSRKSLILASVEALPDVVEGEKFDLITMNWLLHHLIGTEYRACRNNCLSLLERCRTLLNPGGVILITENMFDGYFGTNIPSWLIFRVTRIRAPWIVRLTHRFANTAGTGVCFRSQRSWVRLFAAAGYRIAREDRGRTWGTWFRTKLILLALFSRIPSHMHFYLSDNAKIGG